MATSSVATSSVALLALLLLGTTGDAVPYGVPQGNQNAEFYDVVRQLLDLNSGFQEQVGQVRKISTVFDFSTLQFTDIYTSEVYFGMFMIPKY